VGSLGYDAESGGSPGEFTEPRNGGKNIEQGHNPPRHKHNSSVEAFSMQTSLFNPILDNNVLDITEL
jgi:hypothetical protein